MSWSELHSRIAFQVARLRMPGGHSMIVGPVGVAGSRLTVAIKRERTLHDIVCAATRLTVEMLNRAAKPIDTMSCVVHAAMPLDDATLLVLTPTDVRLKSYYPDRPRPLLCYKSKYWTL